MNKLRFKIILYFILFISPYLVFSHPSFAQEKQTEDNTVRTSMNENVFTADKPAPGQLAELTIIETKLPDGMYEYRFIIHNKSTDFFLRESFNSDSEASKRGKNLIWNWGLIIGDKELASSLTCPSMNDLNQQYYHYYNKKGVLRCKKWIQPGNRSSDEGKVELTDAITHIVTPVFLNNFILKSEGFNPSDHMNVGFVWFWAQDKWIPPGKSLEGFGFTLKKPLDRKKIKFWTFYKTEFSNENIKFINNAK